LPSRNQKTRLTADFHIKFAKQIYWDEDISSSTERQECVNLGGKIIDRLAYSLESRIPPFGMEVARSRFGQTPPA
jgi:hypothetical protein